MDRERLARLLDDLLPGAPCIPEMVRGERDPGGDGRRLALLLDGPLDPRRVEELARSFDAVAAHNRDLLDRLGYGPEVRDELTPLLLRVVGVSEFPDGRAAEAREMIRALIRGRPPRDLPEPDSAAACVALAAAKAVAMDLPRSLAALAQAARLRPEDAALAELCTRMTRVTGPVGEAAARPGMTLDGWKLDALLGAGGFGQVFRAHKAGRPAALKVMHPELSADAGFAERFRREIMTLAALPPHPNLVRILDFGKENGCWFAAMELIDGTTLEGYLTKRGRLTVPQARKLFGGVADGLAVVHARGVVHRDVKPSNVVLRQDGSPVLVDFGIAASDAPGLTRAAAAAGYTALFASPEQLRGRTVDARSDVYSLAATLLYALTYDAAGRRGRVPDDFEPEDVPSDLREVLRQALSPRAAKRHAGAADFRAHLDVTRVAAVPVPPRPTPAAGGNLLDLPLEEGCAFGRWSLWLDGRDLFALYREADAPLCREGKDLPELQRMTDELIRVPLGFNGWWEYRTPRTEAGKVHTVYSPGHLEVCYLNYLLYRCLNDPRAPRYELPVGTFKAERWKVHAEPARLVLAYEPEGLQIVLERESPYWYAPGYKLKDRIAV